MGHCDDCGALAYVHVILDTMLPLSFCAHHAREYDAGLSAYVILELDQRELLTA